MALVFNPGRDVPIGFLGFFLPKAMSIPEGDVGEWAEGWKLSFKLLNWHGQERKLRPAAQLEKERSKIQLVQGFSRGLGYATLISCRDQLPDGLSCLRGVLGTAAPDLVDAGTVMGLFWERPMASAHGRETTREAGK